MVGHTLPVKPSARRWYGSLSLFFEREGVLMSVGHRHIQSSGREGRCRDGVWTF